MGVPRANWGPNPSLSGAQNSRSLLANLGLWDNRGKIGIRDRPIFRADLQIRTTFGLGWMGGFTETGCSDFKGNEKSVVQICKSVRNIGRTLMGLHHAWNRDYRDQLWNWDYRITTFSKLDHGITLALKLGLRGYMTSSKGALTLIFLNENLHSTYTVFYLPFCRTPT